MRKIISMNTRSEKIFLTKTERQLEKMQVKQIFHLEPPQGLLNDPNGLC